MHSQFSRRRFVQGAFAGGALAGLGDFGFLSQLQPLSAAETKLPPGAVQFRPDIEPLVRLLEETPRDSLLETIGARIRRGLNYRDVLARCSWPAFAMCSRAPVGFKFHAVLVVNSAHLASIQSPDEHRWLPIFWALITSRKPRPKMNGKGIGPCPRSTKRSCQPLQKPRRIYRGNGCLGRSAADAAAAALCEVSA